MPSMSLQAITPAGLRNDSSQDLERLLVVVEGRALKPCQGDS